MRLYPKSLLWRTLLLIAVLILISHFALLKVFELYQREPRAIQQALRIASIVNLTRIALITSDREKRETLLLELDKDEGVHVYTSLPNELKEQNDFNENASDLPQSSTVAALLRQQLGKDTKFFLQRNDLQRLWVSFHIDDDEYWLVLPRSSNPTSVQWKWMGGGAVILFLSFLGAYLIAFRVNRPLRQLVEAADKIGKRELPNPLAETGATEIASLSKAFNQMTRNLKQLDQDRALLLAGISHDLRTPLARLRLSTEMLKSIDPQLQRGLVSDVEEMDAIINQFLDFARDEHGEKIEPVNLNDLVTTVMTRFKERVQGITIELSNVPPLNLRPMAMQRLITNLLENAIRYGGKKITIQTQKKNSAVILSVLDNGPGIPTSEIKRMMQPFTRLDLSRGGFSGAGLGLAIVERIAQMHGATIELVNRPEGGLEARLTFTEITLVTTYPIDRKCSLDEA